MNPLRDVGSLQNIFWIAVDLIRPRAALEPEILVLRQQIIVLRRGRPSRLSFLAIETARLITLLDRPAS
jgi:hypothetical protein